MISHDLLLLVRLQSVGLHDLSRFGSQNLVNKGMGPRSIKDKTVESSINQFLSSYVSLDVIYRLLEKILLNIPC